MASMTINEAVQAAKKQGIALTGVPKPQAKLPTKTLGGVVDQLHDVREARLALNKVVEAIKEEEQRLTDHIIDTVNADLEGGAVGKRYKAIIQRDQKPVIEDYDKFTAHIKRTGNFDLLNRAVNAAAVKERWENNKEVPGIGHFSFKKLSITKVK